MPERCGGLPETQEAPPSTKKDGGHRGAAAQSANNGADKLAHQR